VWYPNWNSGRQPCVWCRRESRIFLWDRRKRPVWNDVLLKRPKEGEHGLTGTNAERLSLSEMVGVFARDIRYALRSLAGARGLTITVAWPMQLKRSC
jgi:hypothetical protein